MARLRYLDRKVVLVWLLPELGAIFAIGLIASLGFLVFGGDLAVNNVLPFLAAWPKPLAVLFFFLLPAMVIGVPSYLWVHLQYINFTYQFADNELVIQEGVFSRHRTVIPYARIQNISIEHTFFERLISLATLKIDTAGANPGVSEGILPGVSNLEQIMSELMSRVEKSKKGPGAGLGDMSAEEFIKSEKELLVEMVKELREIRRALGVSDDKKIGKTPDEPPTHGGHRHEDKPGTVAAHSSAHPAHHHEPAARHDAPASSAPAEKDYGKEMDDLLPAPRPGTSPSRNGDEASLAMLPTGQPPGRRDAPAPSPAPDPYALAPLSGRLPHEMGVEYTFAAGTDERHPTRPHNLKKKK